MAAPKITGAYRPLPVPLYQRVFGVLFQRIQNGLYEAGTQLPTETELSAEFGVSKGTIRQAMTVLAERGLIVRRQGSGTFVADYTAPTRFVGSFADLVIGQKKLHQRDFRIERHTPFPPPTRADLDTEQTEGTAILRRREVNGEIFTYSIQYLSPTIADLVTRDELVKLGFIPLLHSKGIVVKGADQTVTAELADVDVAANLEVELGAPVLSARRLLRSDRGAVEVVQAWYRGDLFEWRSALTLSRSKDHLIISSRHPVDDTAD